MSRVKVKWSHRPPSAPLGRFGGGWQWKLGVQASALRRSSGTVIVSLLVGDLRIDWGRATHYTEKEVNENARTVSRSTPR